MPALTLWKAVLVSLVLHALMLVFLLNYAPSSNLPSGVRLYPVLAPVEILHQSVRKKTSGLNTSENRGATSDSDPAESKAEVTTPREGEEGLVIRPVYPALSRERGEEGSVSLRVHFNEGGVQRVEVVESSGFSRLDQAAVEAAKTAVYERESRSNPTRDLKLRFQLR